jgi:hypothetical protein
MRGLSSVSVGGLVLTTALLAQGQAVSPDAAKQGKGGSNPAGQVAEQMLRQMDTNQDGKVSRGEFTSSPDYFNPLGVKKDGFIVLAEIRPGMGNLLRKDVPHVPPPRASTGLVPLTDLKTCTYQGKEGGLDPGGRNERPPAHEEACLRLARAVQPLDARGEPSADGRIVLLSIGMSNTTISSRPTRPPGSGCLDRPGERRPRRPPVAARQTSPPICLGRT